MQGNLRRYDDPMSFTVSGEDLRRALAAWQGRAKPSTIPTPRYLCRVQSWGEGPPLVILHGMSDVPVSFCMMVEHLASHFRCHVIELASGDRDHCRYRAYRHHHHVDDLLAVIDALKLDSINLFGSSFGSTVSLRFAASHPSRVNRLILQGGFPRRPLNRFERGLARLARYWPGKMKDLFIRPRVMAQFDRPQFAAADPAIYDFFLQCSGETPIQCAARRGLMLNELDLRPLLPSIRTPTLMIGGDRDGLVPRWCEAELEHSLPMVRRVEFANCGHYPQYTHPRETADAIIDAGDRPG